MSSIDNMDSTKQKNRSEESIKKSKLQASDAYDFHKLAAAGECFLPMTWKELRESVIFVYDTKGMTSFTEVRKEEYVTILNLLIQAKRFQDEMWRYHFSMEPGNLYYHTSGKVAVRSRDLVVNSKGEADFLLCYKALIACALTGRYHYRDYLEGGEELLQKHARTAKLFSILNVDELTQYLEELKQTYIQKQKKTKVYVSRKVNRIWKIAAVILLLSTILLGSYGGIQYFHIIPHLTAINHAGNAFVENDMLGVIDSLKQIDVEDLKTHQKYMLALAHLQSENLTSEQKHNIASRLSLSSNPRELEYWIRLGRLDMKTAIDLAMQLSNDELLLYAYLKQQAQVEADLTLDGAEKGRLIRDIQARIDELAKRFE